MEKLIRFFKDEEGVTAIEYGLIAALLSVMIIGAVTATSTAVQATFNAASLVNKRKGCARPKPDRMILLHKHWRPKQEMEHESVT